MGKYVLMIPLIASVYVDIEAENEDEAWEIGQKLYDQGKIDFEGYDNDSICTWEMEKV